MQLFRKDINTGNIFKRTSSNYPIDSIQRARIDLTTAKLGILKELTETGCILPMAIAMNKTL